MFRSVWWDGRYSLSWVPEGCWLGSEDRPVHGDHACERRDLTRKFLGVVGFMLQKKSPDI